MRFYTFIIGISIHKSNLEISRKCDIDIHKMSISHLL